MIVHKRTTRKAHEITNLEFHHHPSGSLLWYPGLKYQCYLALPLHYYAMFWSNGRLRVYHFTYFNDSASHTWPCWFYRGAGPGAWLWNGVNGGHSDAFHTFLYSGTIWVQPPASWVRGTSDLLWKEKGEFWGVSRERMNLTMTEYKLFT